MRLQRILSWASGLLTIAFALVLLLFNPPGLVPLLIGCLVIGAGLLLVALVVGSLDKERPRPSPPIHEDKNVATMARKPGDEV